MDCYFAVNTSKESVEKVLAYYRCHCIATVDIGTEACAHERAREGDTRAAIQCCREAWRAHEKPNTGRKSQVEILQDRKMVGPGGLEPLTSSVSRKRSNQLSYGPTASKSFS